VTPEERATWLRERLTGDRAEREWSGVVSRALEALYDRPWTELVPRETLAQAIAAHRTPERGRAIGLGVSAAIRSAIESARADDAPVERFVDDSARDALVRLVRRPGLVPEPWVRHVFRQPAAEALAADTLYRTLRDFSTVIPRTLAAVLPGLLGRFAKFGSSLVDRVVGEIEGRLEPEIRRYVEAGTRRALERAADFAVAHLDAEVNLDSRESLLRFWLASSGRELAVPVSDDVLGDIDALGAAFGQLWATSPLIGDEIAARLDALYAEAAGDSVRDVVERVAGPVAPPFEAWAQAAWPLVRAALETDAIGAWLEDLAREIDAER